MYQIRTDDNVCIGVEDINPQCPDCIMLVHGWPMERDIFEYQTTFFARKGFRCLLPNLRGFGDSDTSAADYTYDRLAKDLYIIIRRLRPRNLTLLGYDMGGAVCVRYMSRFSGYCVCRLALVAAAVPSFTSRIGCEFGMEQATMNDLITLALTDRARMVADYVPLFYKENPTEAALRRVEGVCMDNSIIATVECGKTLLRENLSRELESIDVPCGIFHGSGDIITPFELANIQRDSIPNAQLFEFADTGHILLQEQVEQFNESLLAFVEQN